MLSHASAAHLFGLRGSRGAVEALRRSGGAWHPGIRLHQTRRLDPSETTIERGIPVTTVERTLFDMAARLDAKQLERDLVTADRSKLLRWAALNRLLELPRGRKGAGWPRRVWLKLTPEPAMPFRPPRSTSWRCGGGRICRSRPSTYSSRATSSTSSGPVSESSSKPTATPTTAIARHSSGTTKSTSIWSPPLRRPPRDPPPAQPQSEPVSLQRSPRPPRPYCIKFQPRRNEKLMQFGGRGVGCSVRFVRRVRRGP